MHGMTDEQSVMDAIPSVGKGPFKVVPLPTVPGYATINNTEGVNALAFRSVLWPSIASIALCNAICARFNKMWDAHVRK